MLKGTFVNFAWHCDFFAWQCNKLGFDMTYSDVQITMLTLEKDVVLKNENMLI